MQKDTMSALIADNSRVATWCVSEVCHAKRRSFLAILPRDEVERADEALIGQSETRQIGNTIHCGIYAITTHWRQGFIASQPRC